MIVTDETSIGTVAVEAVVENAQTPLFIFPQTKSHLLNIVMVIKIMMTAKT